MTKYLINSDKVIDLKPIISHELPMHQHELIFELLLKG